VRQLLAIPYTHPIFGVDPLTVYVPCPHFMVESQELAGWTGLEPATFCVTGRRSNQLSYHPVNGTKGYIPGDDRNGQVGIPCQPFTAQACPSRVSKSLAPAGGG